MDNRYIIGRILIHVGEQLCNPKSKLYNSFVLSNEQLMTCLALLKVASSPQTHVLYIGDMAMRYGVTDRTIRNWVRDGIMPRGKKHDSGDTRDYWLSHDLTAVDESLIRKGVLKRSQLKSADDRLKKLLDNFKW